MAFVLLVEEDPAYTLVSVIEDIVLEPQDSSESKADKEPSELAKHVAAREYKEVIEKGLFGSMKKILDASADDINTVFSLCFSLLHQIGSREVGQMILRFSVALSEDPQKHARLKLRLLTILFNLLDEPSPLRHVVFIRILNFALASNNCGLLKSQFSQIKGWLESWTEKLTAEEKTNLHFVLYQVAEAAGEINISYEYLQSFLESLQGGSEKACEAAKPHALKAIIAAVSSVKIPTVIRSDNLASLDAVKILRQDQNLAPAFEVLQIFATENVAGYVKFTEEHKGVVEKLGFDHELNMENIRTLTLCSVAMEKEEISYSELQKALLVDNSDDLEDAVIQAITSDRIHAKLDQENEIVIVSRHTPREFDQSSWASMSDRLQNWKSNIEGVLGNLQQRQAREAHHSDDEDDM